MNEKASRRLYNARERSTALGSLDQEAEAVVDELWRLGDDLESDDPAVVREVFRRLVERIDCRWEPLPGCLSFQGWSLSKVVACLSKPR